VALIPTALIGDDSAKLDLGHHGVQHGTIVQRGRSPTMKSAKQEAREVIEKLPESATWDEVMYELYVRQKIAEGLRAADEGRVVPHEEVKRRFLAR
jgi:predicted transcriptional regulator